MTTKTTTEPLATGQTLSFSPVAGIVVRLQRVTDAAYVVMVENTLLIDSLRRSYATEYEARLYARAACEALRSGWSLDFLIEVMSFDAGVTR